MAPTSRTAAEAVEALRSPLGIVMVLAFGAGWSIGGITALLEVPLTTGITLAFTVTALITFWGVTRSR